MNRELNGPVLHCVCVCGRVCACVCGALTCCKNMWSSGWLFGLLVASNSGRKMLSRISWNVVTLPVVRYTSLQRHRRNVTKRDVTKQSTILKLLRDFHSKYGSMDRAVLITTWQVLTHYTLIITELRDSISTRIQCCS